MKRALELCMVAVLSLSERYWRHPQSGGAPQLVAFLSTLADIPRASWG
ncbi:MAG TPA: hypothetical protein VFE61_02225 [Candidatus Sulfotelmatobacter sp.]|jgi:hypothetical protein|nr:hypothetical protein [Candidatus Sulfotelmatobacter sp.]